MGQAALSNDAQLYSGVAKGYESLVRKDPLGNWTLSIVAGGVHCAACIQSIESSLYSDPDIDSARLNFSTGRLNIAWHGDSNRANDFVNKVEELGYSVRPFDENREQQKLNAEENFLLMCLGLASFAMGNIMLVSVGLWTTTAETMGIATRDFMHWVSAVIALPTIIFSGRPFFYSAAKALRAGHTNMDVPISIGITIAGIMSLYETARHGEHAYFDSAVMLIFFLLIGRYLDFRARKSARSTATDLLSSLSGFAMISEDGKLRRITIRDLEEGHLVLVAAGEKIPADGIVLNGQGEVDTSLVTGETLPRQIGPGDALYSGTINLDAPLQIQIVKRAENSLLADIVRLMEKAEQGQARYVRIADRAAKLYTPVVHSCALLSFLYWFFIGGMAWEQALMIAVTVLIITCPCALGLAVPVAQVLATGRLLRRGILVKAGDALERLAEIDTVLLDKTGTLTQGCLTLEGVYEPSALHLAASLAHHSRHPLSQAIAKACEIEPLPLTDVCEYAGRGIAGLYDGRVVRLGSRDWCGNADTLPTGKTELWLDDGAGKCTVFYFTDILREDSPQTITRLKMAGLYPAILSGDRVEVVEQVARECGIDEYHAGLLPTDKFERLESLKKQNHKILMVGDGLNDAPALADAHVSMAPGTAIDMAQNAADIVFMGGKLSPVYEAYKTARMTQKIVKQNFALAVIYNLFAIPLAIGGFVTPFVAALAMSGSSVIVIVNSFRLRWNA